MSDPKETYERNPYWSQITESAEGFHAGWVWVVLIVLVVVALVATGIYFTIKCFL